MTKQERFMAASCRFTLAVGETMTTRMNTTDLLCVIAALQLALRHPNMPARTGRSIRRFVDAHIQQIDVIEPVLAELLRLGDLPEHDTTAERTGNSDGSEK